MFDGTFGNSRIAFLWFWSRRFLGDFGCTAGDANEPSGEAFLSLQPTRFAKYPTKPTFTGQPASDGRRYVPSCAKKTFSSFIERTVEHDPAPGSIRLARAKWVASQPHTWLGRYSTQVPRATASARPALASADRAGPRRGPRAPGRTSIPRRTLERAVFFTGDWAHSFRPTLTRSLRLVPAPDYPGQLRGAPSREHFKSRTAAGSLATLKNGVPPGRSPRGLEAPVLR
jgi:hypothetical protein